MKNIFKFFGAFLTVVLAATLTGCDVKENLETSDVGLHIKVFFPTKVVAGQPMTINGSGFSDTKEIVFPGDVKVTDFQIVSNDMIRVSAPSGISSEGGHIVVRTETGEAESPLPLTLGNTAVTGYSVQAGETIQGGQQMTIYGTDLEFVKSIKLLDEDGNPVYVEDVAFNRKGTSTIIFTVPQNIYTGTFAGVISTIDEKSFTMPEISYEPAPTGYWETRKTTIWKGDGSLGEVGWSSTYRFAPESNPTGEELCVVPADQWDVIKNGTFYMLAQGSDWVQMRITDGWWSATWTGADITTGDERIINNGDGTYYIEINLTGDPLQNVIDVQHLLLTGGGYTPLELYYYEEVWVEFDDGPKEVVMWENDGSLGEISWSSDYRFAQEGTDSEGHAHAELPADQWDVIKNGTFYMLAEGSDYFQVQVTDGWWSTTWTGAPIETGDERIIDNGDGTFHIEIKLDGDPLKDFIDERHLLFTGDGYTPLKLYYYE